MEYKRYVQRNNHFLDFPDSDDEEAFMIVFDVSSLEEEELTIEFLEENKLKLSLKHGFRNTGNINFSRDCTYVYSLPENVQTTNLVAHWSGDNFLVIKEKKTEATERASQSREDSNRQEFKPDGTVNSPATINENEKMKRGIISSNGSTNESELMIIQERKSSEASSESEEKLIEKLIEKKSTTASRESEEKIMQERISMSASSENEEKIMQEKKSAEASNESEEKLIQEKKSTNASRESEEKIMQERKSMRASSESNKVSMQEVKSMEAPNIMQTESRLIPKRVHTLFNHMLCESDLQAAMNDIEKRMKFVHEIIDKHRFESLN